MLLLIQEHQETVNFKKMYKKKLNTHNIARRKKMKKLLVILSIFLMVGCELNNTPTKKVEQFLSNYQVLHKDVISDLDGMINKTNYTSEQKERYKELMKKQYKSLVYEIKEETIDGNNAYVTVQIEVTNFGKRLAEAENYLNDHRDEFTDNGVYNESKFLSYQLDELEKEKERVKYTLTFSLTKQDGKWEINDLTEAMEDKINGIYMY